MIETKNQSGLGATALATKVSKSGDTMTGNLTISNTAPTLILTDTTASAKSLTIATDTNITDLRESAGASGSLLALDLANKRVGIGTKVFTGTINGVGNDTLKVQGPNGSLMGFNDFGSGFGWFGTKVGSTQAYGAMCFTTYVSFGSASDHPVHLRVFNTSRMDINNKGNVRIGANLATPATHSAQFEVQSGLSTTITSLIQGASSQSANLTEWQNSSSNILLSVEPDGEIDLIQDSKAIKFGAGLDATIMYDGTNLLINPKLVGTGYVNIQGKIVIDAEANIVGDLNHDGSNIGFFGTAPTTQQTELTDELTTITFTAPGTPDYAMQDLTQITPYGFVTADEAQTLLSVIANLQTRVNELETKLTAYGLLIDAD